MAVVVTAAAVSTAADSATAGSHSGITVFTGTSITRRPTTIIPIIARITAAG
jgi:hypothetical protein